MPCYNSDAARQRMPRYGSDAASSVRMPVVIVIRYDGGECTMPGYDGNAAHQCECPSL